MDSTSQTSHSETISRPNRTRSSVQSATVPAVDVVEDSSGITVWLDVPGVPREKLNITVQDDTLHVEAESVVPIAAHLKVHYAEVRFPNFVRAFSLGQDFDSTKIDAKLNDGVLRLFVPRREEARPRRIEVRVD